MKRTSWVIIDTETDGLFEPIHVVELAGQLMDGWEPVGEPFRMLLNHDVPIPQEAVAIHGYTQEYLRRHGGEPRHVHESFRDYARDYPLVAHNLSYDWNRCLEPEWARLGIPQIGQRGFCCMMLARRLVPETSSYQLDVLKQCFQLTQSKSHQAKNDVLAVVEMFQRVYKPRLELAGFDTFDSIAAFAKRTPVAKCLDLIRSASTRTRKPETLKDAWYYLDAKDNDHGPFTAWEVSQSADLDRYYVWREGMSGWMINQESAEFLALSNTQPAPAVKGSAKTIDGAKTMSELIGLCRGLIADDKITTAEVMFLNSWLQNIGFISEWPASEIAQTMERILEDGVVTKEEKEELKRLIQKITAVSSTPAMQPSQHAAPVADPVLTTPPTALPYVIVELKQGTREWLEWRHGGLGASDAPVVMGENPWKTADELLREKRGPATESVQNAAMSRGTLLEPEARKCYMLRSGRGVQPACLQSNQYEWLRASVDGITSDGDAVVEIKCGESVYRKTSQSGRVPDYYYGQLQHILAVTGLESIDFWCYLPTYPELLLPVVRDDSYINRLLNAEFKFWKGVQRAA
ncbi:MAG: YqaJ viral recombinase family protein [Verrucomicrobiia bacterium]